MLEPKPSALPLGYTSFYFNCRINAATGAMPQVADGSTQNPGKASFAVVSRGTGRQSASDSARAPDQHPYSAFACNGCSNANEWCNALSLSAG
jgi:hypothetical protein